MRRARWRRERGSALIESIALGLALVVPVVWALGVMADLHRAALAATGAAREAAAGAARSVDVADADRAVDRAVAAAFADHGLDPARARVGWTAMPGLPRGSAVELEVAYPVAVARIPFLGEIRGPTIWMRARHHARVDLFRSR